MNDACPMCGIDKSSEVFVVAGNMKIRELTAERGRYKEALERIIKCERGHDGSFLEPVDEIAKAALGKVEK